MPRGRPIGSEIRQRIVDILAVLETGYGYDIHKIYCQLFAPCTREVVYYHLRTGVTLGLFLIEKVVSEKGEYSWGKTVEKTYYRLGPNAMPRPNPEILGLIAKKKKTPADGNRKAQQAHANT